MRRNTMGIIGGGVFKRLPPAAAAVGYNVRTFGPNVTLGVNWFKFGATAAATQNADGSLTVAGVNNTFCYQVHTWSGATGPTNFTGVAFGGGAYFECVFTIANLPVVNTNGWPSFWANDIEMQAAGSTVTPTTQWPGQASDYGDWIEMDFFEFDYPGTTPAQYGTALHNWYGVVGSNVQTNTSFSAFNPPGNPDLTKKQTFGALWVPATSTTQGYYKTYFNNILMSTVTWDQYNASLAPPPVAGTSAYSIMDTRHMYPILGSGPDNPMTVYSVSVWQASSANNIGTPPP